MAMITFQDLPSTSTPLNAANLNNNFSELTPANSYNTSTTKSYACDYVNDCNTYSTSETLTGKYWINGKPIYRKTYTGVSISTGTGNYFASGISNIDTLIKLEGILKYTGNNQYITIPSYYSSTIFITANYQYNENRVYYDSGFFSGTAIFVLEYTKTTD